MFVVADHCTTECIGLHAAKSRNRFEAWSQSASASSTASAVSAMAPPLGCGCVTTTGRTTWPTISAILTTAHGESYVSTSRTGVLLDAGVSRWTKAEC